MSYNEQEAHIEILLIKKQLGEISSEELTHLEAYLKTHDDALRQQNYFEGNAADAMADLRSLEVNEQWNAFHNQMTETFVPKPPRRWIRPYAIMAAATILGVILVAMNFFFFRGQPSIPAVKHLARSGGMPAKQVILRLAGGQQVILNQTGRQHIQAGNAQLVADNKTLVLPSLNDKKNAWNTLEVPCKLDYKVNLPDGSTVHLNAVSTLKFPFAFNNSTREVYLEGEAYFTVAKKPDQPFIVHTPHGDIQVLGTEFNVNTYTAGVVKTALVGGAIKVSDQEKSVILKPGEYLTLTTTGESVTALDSKSVLSWRNGVYYFRNTPFREIAAVIPRWFDVKVAIDDADINELPFTGQLDKSASLEAFLQPIQYTADIKYYYKDNVLHIIK
jgi:transmembrane sensor